MKKSYLWLFLLVGVMGLVSTGCDGCSTKSSGPIEVSQTLSLPIDDDREDFKGFILTSAEGGFVYIIDDVAGAIFTMGRDKDEYALLHTLSGIEGLERAKHAAISGDDETLYIAIDGGESPGPLLVLTRDRKTGELSKDDGIILPEALTPPTRIVPVPQSSRFYVTTDRSDHSVLFDRAERHDSPAIIAPQPGLSGRNHVVSSDGKLIFGNLSATRNLQILEMNPPEVPKLVQSIDPHDYYPLSHLEGILLSPDERFLYLAVSGHSPLPQANRSRREKAFLVFARSTDINKLSRPTIIELDDLIDLEEFAGRNDVLAISGDNKHLFIHFDSTFYVLGRDMDTGVVTSVLVKQDLSLGASSMPPRAAGGHAAFSSDMKELYTVQNRNEFTVLTIPETF